MDIPDRHTLAYWSQQMSGMAHRQNRMDAEWESQHALMVELRARVDAADKRIVDDAAVIGELRARLEAIERKHGELVKRLAEKFKEVK